MAQFRFSAQVIGRSSGRSSVAAAAYRAGVSLADDRTGLVHDFSRRHGITHTEIMAPDNAPAWMSDRARLWNAVEKVETRTNSQLAREIQLSLAHELTDAQRLDLVRGFVRDQFVSRGMIADIAIHAPGKEGDDRNHHAHIMLTMRELTGEGFHKSKATPTARAWNASENIEQWREAWGEYQNRTFRSLGIAASVDHRSLAAQGVDREATFHLGPSANDMERRGKPSRIVDQNRAIEIRNTARENSDRAATVISLEIERLKRAEAKTLHERLAALESAQALTVLDLERRQQTQSVKLQSELSTTYGDQRRNLAVAEAALSSRLAATGFRKVLRDLSGRSERDRQQLDGIKRNLAQIVDRERDAGRSQQLQHTAERAAQQLAQTKQQEATRKTVAAEFEKKRRDELRARREAQIAEQARRKGWADAEAYRQRFKKPESRRPQPPTQTARPNLVPVPAPLEKPTVKREFDSAAEIERQRVAKAATERKFLTQPAPQPTPRGDVITPRREAVDVPKPGPVKLAPAKRETPPPIRAASQEAASPTPAEKPAPTPAKDWTTAPAPAVPTVQKDWGAASATPDAAQPRKDWKEAAKDRPREIKPLPTKDRDFDRER